MSGIPHNGHQAPKPQPVQIVAPSPVPFTFQAELVMANGTPMVQLRWFTPSGVSVIFCSPDDARKVSNMINEKAGGLVIPAPEAKGVG